MNESTQQAGGSYFHGKKPSSGRVATQQQQEKGKGS